MAKKVSHTEETIMGVTTVNGVTTPYWEDDQPEGSEDWASGIGSNITSLSMCLAPDRKRPSPKLK